MYGAYYGIAEIIGVAIYLAILFVAVFGSVLFVRAKQKLFAWWWVSVMANIFAFLYLMGAYSIPAYVMQAVSISIWPLVNIIWLGYLLYRRQKMAKAKKNI